MLIHLISQGLFNDRSIKYDTGITPSVRLSHQYQYEAEMTRADFFATQTAHGSEPLAQQ